MKKYYDFSKGVQGKFYTDKIFYRIFKRHGFVCFLRSIYLSIKYLTFISGHDYILFEEDEEKQVLVCERCGKKSIGWW